MPYGVKSYTAKKLAKGTYYKFVIVAYRYSKGEKHTIATSTEVHCTTKGSKYGNPQKLIYNKKKVNVKLGKKLTNYLLTDASLKMHVCSDISFKTGR